MCLESPGAISQGETLEELKVKIKFRNTLNLGVDDDPHLGGNTRASALST